MLISFSGIDSSGKSTQIANIVKYYLSINVKTKVIWSRGGYTPIINGIKLFIRKIIPSSIPDPSESSERDKTFNKKWVRFFWLNISIVDLIFFYFLYFRILKILGYSIIADRYLWDTYIDFELKFNKESFEKNLLWKILVFFYPKPDSSIILIIPIEESLRRSKLKKEPFSENFNRRKKRLELYHYLIKKGKWANVIDGSGPINEVWYNIKNKLE